MAHTPDHFDDFFKQLGRRRIVKGSWRILRYVLMILVVLMVIGWFVLQNGWVQNRLMGYVTDYLSEELDTKVAASRIDFDFFDKLVLEGFYVEDHRGDTLLFSRELKASFDVNLLKLFRKQFDIDDIYLTDTRMKIMRDTGEQFNNVQVILKRLVKEKKKTGPTNKGKLPLLSVENVYLDNITFLNDDRVKGEEIITFLDGAHIAVNFLNLENELVAIDNFTLEGPNVVLIQKEPHPLPIIPPVITVDSTTENTAIPTKIDTTDFKLLIANFELTDGAFSLRNFRKNPTPSTTNQELDFNNLTVNNIQIDLENFSMQAGVFETKINKLQARENSGFELSNLSAEVAKVSTRKIEFSGLDLRTPYSSLQDKLSLNYRSYEDFKNFPEKVLLQGNFNNSRIALRDILVFAKGLKNNAFFAQNADQVVEIDGKIQGRINSLKGDNVQIRLGETTFLKGSFSSRNLTKKGEEYLSFNLDNFESDMQTLRLLIPGFNPPANFDKIGRFKFDGNFLGFFIDFVAAGNLQTELGTATMDMRMNLRKGREMAQYAGNLALQNFDLGRWTGNKDMGMVSFQSRVEEGQGLTLETVDARVGGLISELTFKNYLYKNLSLDGALKRNLFDGKLSIQDDNIDFTFDGSVDFTDSIPKFDFASQINRIDIKTLNLSSKDFVLKGNTKIQLTGNNIFNIQGDLLLRDFSIVKDGTDTFRMDSLLVFSELFPDTRRSFSVGSDILDLELDGIFDIQEVPNLLIAYLEDNYGGLASRFNIKTNGNTIKESKFKFDLALRNSANWTRLLDPDLDTLENIVASGYFDNIRDSVYLELSVPGIHYKNLYFDDILLDIEGKEDFSDIHLEVYHSKINGQNFEPIELTGELAGDTLFFEVVSTNFTSVFDDLKLNGQFFPLPEENFQISFFPSNLVIVKQLWDIAPDNYIRFGENYLETKNFDLQSGEKRISINSIGERGLQVELENLSLGLIDDWLDFDKMNFSQTINLEISAGDVFNLKDLQLNAIADTLEINGDDWGQLSLTANLPDLTASTDLYTSITKGEEQLIVKGALSPFKKEGRVFENDFDFDVSIKNYNLSIAEYFISNIISETVGKFDSGIKLNGKFDKPNINGSIRIYDASLRINYTNTRYDIPDSYTTINNQIFDVSGNYMIDSLGNRANLYGGFLHDHLKDWRMGATISADKFLFLNTTKENNPIYHGTGIGSGSIRFSGSFKQIDIDINAKTGLGTKVVIPVSNATNAAEVKFIEYIEADKKEDDANARRRTELRGVAVNMNIDMTEEADAMLVFDERAGDIMRGRGNGNIQFSVNRLGEISMYGTYDIVQGNYLFTLLNLVNKPFVVKEGGTIRWEGDPYNAIIDIEAEYRGLNTSLSNFISEYLDGVNPGELELEARKSQNVLLTMFLNGPLKQPDINFDISFPGLQGQLENVADSKLRIIRQDQAELNRQVFGLLVIGGFLPSSNSNALAGRGDLIPINTISELLSNQLSIHLTQLLSEVFTDVGFISGVDFNINYNVYDNELSLTDNGLPRTTGSALQLRQSLDLFNDRLTVQVGGNIDWGSNLVETSNSAFLAGDVVIEYAVTKDRRFKVRAYQLTDATILGRRNKRGLGISWRREFDNINEFFKNMKKDAKDNLKSEGRKAN